MFPHKFYNRSVAIRFEWDDEKNIANQRKHKLSFEEAVLVFRDPKLVMYPDRHVDGEQRWHTVGFARGVLLVLIVHTVREEAADEVMRIISARYGERKERRIYEEENGQLYT
jgi:uncharacterized DUF497 family protein